jgi:hypothetical protein
MEVVTLLAKACSIALFVALFFSAFILACRTASACLASGSPSLQLFQLCLEPLQMRHLCTIPFFFVAALGSCEPLILKVLGLPATFLRRGEYRKNP